MYSKHQRFEGIKRNYSPETVEKLRGSLKIEYTLARRGTTKLWNYLTRGGNSYINAMGALTGKKTSFLSEFPVRILDVYFDAGPSFCSTWKPLSSQIWWMLRCGAQFAWDFSASEFDKLDLLNLNAFSSFFTSLLKITLKKNYDTIFSRPRQPKKIEWRGNLAERQMNFGLRCENRWRLMWLDNFPLDFLSKT